MAVLVNCSQCGKSFYIREYVFKELQEGRRHSVSCSRICAFKARLGRPVMARRRRVSLVCEFCDKSFEDTTVHAQQRRFCSIACKAEYQRTALQGEGNPYYGRKHSAETREKISGNHFRWYGENNPNWRGGVTALKILIRKSKRYKQWRKSVYERDGYRSVLSGKRGQSWQLVAHHVKSFIEILNEMLALYPELSTEKDAPKLCEIALHYEPFWDIANGVTLLKDEHIKLHYEEDSRDDDE